MKRLYVFAKLMVVSITLSAQITSLPPEQTNEIRLIVRGDDMGFCHAANEAIMKCFKEGIETSVEVIVPSSWFPEAVALLESSRVDVGIHLTLTSEWENIKYRPVSDCPTLTDADGYFYPFIWPGKNHSGSSLLTSPWKIEDIEKEFRAQIELAKRKIPRVSHLSAHMGSYDMNPEVNELTKRLAIEYQLNIDIKDYYVTEVRYAGPNATSKDKKKSFLNMLNKLEAGKTYLFVDHPGLNTPELRAISHQGNISVATDRQGVTDVWTSKKIISCIRRRGIKLISYTDLLNDHIK